MDRTFGWTLPNGGTLERYTVPLIGVPFSPFPELSKALLAPLAATFAAPSSKRQYATTSAQQTEDTKAAKSMLAASSRSEGVLLVFKRTLLADFPSEFKAK